jgi:hypothetical protein
LIALERHWGFWTGSVCGAPSLASPRKALAFGFIAQSSGNGGMGNLPYSTSRTTTNDEPNWLEPPAKRVIRKRMAGEAQVLQTRSRFYQWFVSAM